MTLKMTRMIATIVLMSLLAAAPALGHEGTAEATADAAETGKALAKAANTTAAEDAAQAVLVANKLDLDIRLTDRTSVISVDGA